MKIVVFSVGNFSIALPLYVVERVIYIIEFNSFPNVPDFISGYINVEGDFIPVFDPRVIFDIDKKEVELSDQLIIVKSHGLSIALWVDKVNEVKEVKQSEIVPGNELEYPDHVIEGLIKLENGLIIISNPERFLSKEELEKLMISIRKTGNKIKA